MRGKRSLTYDPFYQLKRASAYSHSLSTIAHYHSDLFDRAFSPVSHVIRLLSHLPIRTLRLVYATRVQSPVMESMILWSCSTGGTSFVTVELPDCP